MKPPPADAADTNPRSRVHGTIPRTVLPSVATLATALYCSYVLAMVAQGVGGGDASASRDRDTPKTPMVFGVCHNRAATLLTKADIFRQHADERVGGIPPPTQAAETSRASHIVP